MVPLKVGLLNSIAEGWERKKKQSQDKAYLFKMIVSDNLHNFLFRGKHCQIHCKMQTTVCGYSCSAIINCFCFIKMLRDIGMDI